MVHVVMVSLKIVDDARFKLTSTKQEVHQTRVRTLELSKAESYRTRALSAASFSEPR